MKTEIIVADRRFRVPVRKIKNALSALARDHRASGKIVVILTNSSRMRRLNKAFRGHNRTTDVLAFDLRERKGDPLDGEIYVDLQIASLQAKEHDLAFVEEVVRLSLHGMLHLLGYDDTSESKRKAMWCIQERFVGKVFHDSKRK